MDKADFMDAVVAVVAPRVAGGVAFRRGAGFPESWLGGPTEASVNEADQLKDRIGRLEKMLKALNQRLATFGGEAGD